MTTDLNLARRAAGVDEDDDPARDCATPLEAVEIADKLNYVIDFRRGYVETPSGDMMRFEPLKKGQVYRNTMPWYEQVFTLAARNFKE